MSRKPGHHHKSGMSEDEQSKTLAWHSFIDTIRLLPTVGDKTAEDLRTEEIAREKLARLTAMYDNQPIPPLSDRAQSTIPTPTINVAQPTTPSSAGPGPNTIGKRRRGPSISLSPAPTPSFESQSQSHSLNAASPRVKSARSVTPVPPPSSSVKVKKEAYHDQLPLQAGRRVAFKVPPSSKAEGGEEEEWILVTIRRCLGDKIKYEVVDADDNKTTYQTTLRSIIPLPDFSLPSHVSSHPSQLENLPKGSTVLALYPDTTAFYQATVVASPVPGTGMGAPGARLARADPGAKKGKYVLSFVDDGDNTHEVDAKDVVVFPG